MSALEKLYLDAEEIERKINVESNSDIIKKHEKELNIIYRQIEEIEARDL